MPSIDRSFLSLLQDDYQKYPCFVETGTLVGDTIFALEPYFNTLHTIEISEHYYNSSKNRYKGQKINFIHGDSSKEFITLLETLETKCIFFLDGHWSSGNTGKGEKHCPLVEEITHINNLFLHEAILIVDDYRLFGLRLSEDWTDINKDKLLDILQSRISKVYHLGSELAKDDRLIIHINAKI